MTTLKTPQAEYDAQRVASLWIRHGKDKAVLAYRQIIERVNMKRWEGSAFTTRVREIVGANDIRLLNKEHKCLISAKRSLTQKERKVLWPSHQRL